MTIEQKRDMIIKGYNPNNNSDVQKYLQGIPKQKNWEFADLGSATQKSEEFDDEGNSLGFINEDLLLKNEYIVKEIPIKKQVRKIVENDNNFGLPSRDNQNENYSQQGYKDGIQYLTDFISSLKTGERATFFKSLNETIKKKKLYGNSYNEGLRKAEKELLKRFV